MNQEEDSFHHFKDDKGFTNHTKKNTFWPPRNQAKVIIMLDFDGTCVEHQYPRIGRENIGCIKVLRQLQAKGYAIALNSMRSNFQEQDPKEIDDAMQWLGSRGITVDVVMQGKVNPSAWKSEMKYFVGFQGEKKAICIDDQATGMPLKPAVMTPGSMVDWDKVESDLREAGIL